MVRVKLVRPYAWQLMARRDTDNGRRFVVGLRQRSSTPLKPPLGRIFLLDALGLDKEDEYFEETDPGTAQEGHVWLFVTPQLILGHQDGVANHIDGAKDHVHHDEDDHGSLVGSHGAVRLPRCLVVKESEQGGDPGGENGSLEDEGIVIRAHDSAPHRVQAKVPQRAHEAGNNDTHDHEIFVLKVVPAHA